MEPSTSNTLMNGTRPVSSSGIQTIPFPTPRRNTSRQEWMDMSASSHNYNSLSRPQTVMSPTEQIGTTRMIPSVTSQYNPSYSSLNSRKSVCSAQAFPMAFEAQTPLPNAQTPSAFTRVQNSNVIGTTSSYGMHAGMASQLSIPFSPITVPEFRRYDQSPVIFKSLIISILLNEKLFSQ